MQIDTAWEETLREQLAGRQICVLGSDGFIGSRVKEIIKFLGIPGQFFGRDFNIVSDDLPMIRNAVVIHLAGMTNVQESWANPLDFLAVNTLGTARVMDWARETGATIIYAMTYPYGQPSYLPIDESHSLAALTPYHLSKIEAERIGLFYAREYGVPFVSLRMFNVYGSGQSVQFVLGAIVDQVRDKSKSEIVLQSLEARRDFIYIDDVIDAMFRCMTRGKEGEVFNVGTGVSHSILEVAQMALSISNDKRPIIGQGTKRRSDVDDVKADIGRIVEATGWRPLFALEDGLTRCLS